MAAGRGEFYRTFANALQRIEPPQPQSRARGKPVPKHIHRAPQSLSKVIKADQPKELPNRILKFPKRNILEWLPSEILMKIMSYLDATSLCFLSNVNKLFCHLANDDLLWHKIYMTEFGVFGSSWRDFPKPRLTSGDSSTGLWKQKYFKALAGQDLDHWRHELRDISPYTGLPRQTAHVLRILDVNWHLRILNYFGQELTLKPCNVYFFETSVIVRWSSACLPFFNQICALELYGLKKTYPNKRAPWHSLMMRQDKMKHTRLIGKDRQIILLFLAPGFLIGIWRGQNVIAFIMVCLHFYQLLERSLFGSPVSPYFEPTVSRVRDRSDPQYGLHGYSLHFVLHNTGTQIMSEYFPDVPCHSVTEGSMVLGVIYKNNLSNHRPLSGNIRLPWKSEEREGSIENCCFMTLTLLDESQNPFWCVCSPITIARSRRPLSFDYNGDHFQMDCGHPEGRVKMELVWLHEEKQFVLINFTVLVAINKVNKYFCTNY
ncbi:unnamed protein product [Knipowitschia caucasica]|uniref:F-box domain-containing protein n=1 Tax=Knipowitschia caucasica TaxID=637954 RepID=A0AAV2IXG3_KNICA